jgi:PKD repeat protein
LTLPAAVANASPTVKLTGKGSVDTTSKIATIMIDQKVAVTVRGVTLSGKDCLINSVSSSTAVLSCVLQASPLTAAKRVPLIKFTDNPASLALGGTAAMKLPAELATAVNAVAKKQILTPGLPLGTASGTAQL